MPELAEVEFYRKRWHLAARGERVMRVLTHDSKKLLRKLDVPAFKRGLVGACFEDSHASAKQMLFRFSPDARGSARFPPGANLWLGIHLGMTGELSVAPPDHAPGRHDHLVIVTGKSSEDPAKSHALVFTDPRMFGSIDFHIGPEPPPWWSRIAPPILSPEFTVAAVTTFLIRRARAPIKAVLLMQERFPGIGNWMADEILWRAGIHPARRAGSLSPAEIRTLWRECRALCRAALTAIAGRGNRVPKDLNVGIPRTWLFHHRWARGGRCPKTGKPLAHATIGGRTTCWSPARQSLNPSPARKIHTR